MMQLIYKLFIGSAALATCMSTGLLQARSVAPSVKLEITTGSEQELRVSGTVRAADSGAPVVGANVQVIGFSAAITKDDGTFSLKLPSSTAKITINAPGFQEKIVFAKTGESNLEIWLYEEAYNPIRQEAILFNEKQSVLSQAAAVQTVDLGKYQWKTTSNDNTAQFLQGKIAGLNVVRNSGTTNAGANLTLRGINSFYGTSKPLLVVDGVLYDDEDYSAELLANYSESGLANIDVKDIDNISVLKDGSALYGTKGSNGVIFITTARAKELATRIDFLATTGFNNKPKNLPMMDSRGYRSYLSELLSTQGLGADSIARLPYYRLDAENTERFAYLNETDWQSEVMDHSINQNYYLKVAGGDNIAQYALSAGYTNDRGVLKYDNLTRYNMRLNGDLTLSEKFTVQSNLSFFYNRHDIRNQGVDSHSSPLYQALVKSPFLAPYGFDELGNQSPVFADIDVFKQSNPAVLVSENTIGHNQSYRFVGNLHFNYQFNERYALRTVAGLVYDKGRENFFLPELGVFSDDQPTAEIRNEAGIQNRKLFSLFNDTYLSANNTFGPDHRLSNRIGFRVQQRNAEYDYGLAFNTANDNYVNVSGGSNLLRQIRGGFGNANWVNAYMSHDYAYKERYLLRWDAALDGSSRFGTGASKGALKLGKDAFALNTALHAAWVVSAEDFFRADAINLFKLRASYGVSGNDDIGDYAARTYYISQNFLGVQGLIRGNIGNPALQWERAFKTNLGLDLSLAKERVNISVDLYNHRFKDMITYQALSAQTGMSLAFTNGATMQNNGLDLNITGRLINKPNMKWDMGLQLATYRNKVLTLPGGAFETTYYGARMITTEGGAANQFYGLQSYGVFATARDAANTGLSRRLTDGSLLPFEAGDVHFVDQNGDNIIDEKDRVVIGNPNPDWFGSLNTTFRYKRFSLHALFTYSLGNDVYNATRHRLENVSSYHNQSIAANYRWKEEGQQTNMPRANWGDPLNNAEFSDRWIEDGSYLRLRTINFGYHVPVNHDILKSFDAFLTVNNVFTISKYLGYDPEFSANSSIYSQGIDIGMTPQFRTIQVGIKAGF
ncbi:SusC/RagA family TonB-linked outer membrane protein [Sphingobacterium gobiense]|uniref:SusC/RagA family TonB-linked outer membrane protein n=1 Tax=Sphingobacterium gobiense TaxID=1382456 RepID=A0A2S9JMA6_9SPHI|nr:SusC/RagA family TonB-linked outer membrane protein [Sphingobacterium gobiense]PRD54251.1 SusC/RagA family TonB-linked outer membrane protein [Sphingobacterium gobiense]